MTSNFFECLNAVLLLSKEFHAKNHRDQELDMAWLKSVPEIKAVLYRFAEELYPAIHLASLDQEDSLIEDLGCWIKTVYKVIIGGEFIFIRESQSSTAVYQELVDSISLILKQK